MWSKWRDRCLKIRIQVKEINEMYGTPEEDLNMSVVNFYLSSIEVV